jgi:hypothetical protein
MSGDSKQANKAEAAMSLAKMNYNDGRTRNPKASVRKYAKKQYRRAARRLPIEESKE